MRYGQPSVCISCIGVGARRRAALEVGGGGALEATGEALEGGGGGALEDDAAASDGGGLIGGGRGLEIDEACPICPFIKKVASIGA